MKNHVVDTEGARRADLARIHIAKKALNLSDDEYRDVMFAVARVRSSADLDFTGRKRPAAARRPKRPTPSLAAAPMCRKVRAQLISLGRLPDTYADGIASQMFGVQFFEWCQPDQLHAIVAALAAEQARKGVAFTPRKP